MRRLRKDKENGPRHHSKAQCTAHLVKLPAACYPTQAIGPIPAARTPRLLLMAPFNFHSIQTLEISNADNPIIDIKDGRLTLTAVRGDERIMITAPMGDNNARFDEQQCTVRGQNNARFADNNARFAPEVVKPIQRKTKRRKAYVQVLPATDKRVGESNPLAKLNEASVREILALLADKNMRDNYQTVGAFYSEIGKAYGVCLHTISNIDRGISWKHVAR
jgi:hypothetical protein